MGLTPLPCDMERLKNWFRDQGLGAEDIPKVCFNEALTSIVIESAFKMKFYLEEYN